MIEGAYLGGLPAAGAAGYKPFCRRFQLKVGSVTLLENWNLINGLKLWAMHDFRIMPESAVSARELWVLAPHGTWQFFRITAEAVTEIRSDGSAMPGTLASSPVTHPVLPAGSVITGPGMGGHPSVPVGVCHYLSSLQEKT